jgi:hypothetical protein
MGELSIHRWKGFELYPVINKKTVRFHSVSKANFIYSLKELEFRYSLFIN